MSRRPIYKIFLFLILLLTYGCSVRNINYDREKIIKKYASNFDILVDSKKVDFKNLYLDLENIREIRLDRKNKTLGITQIRASKLVKLSEINLDSLNKGRGGWKKTKIGLIVINGIPLTDEHIEKTLIDLNSIKDFRVLKGKDLEKNGSTIFRLDRDYLIIITD